MRKGTMTTTINRAFGVSNLCAKVTMTMLISLIIFNKVREVNGIARVFIPFVTLVCMNTTLMILFVGLNGLPRILRLVFACTFRPVSTVNKFTKTTVNRVVH